MAPSSALPKAIRPYGIFAPANRQARGISFSVAPRLAVRQPSGEWTPMGATRACSRAVLTTKAPTIHAGCRNAYEEIVHRSHPRRIAWSFAVRVESHSG